MLFELKYRPSAKCPEISQWVWISLYEPSVDFRNNVIDPYKHITDHLEELDNKDFDIHIQFLIDPAKPSGYRNWRGTENDPSPFIIRGKDMGHFYLVFHRSPIKDFFHVEQPYKSLHGREFTKFEKNILIDRFADQLSNIIKWPLILELHKREADRFTKLAIAKLGEVRIVATDLQLFLHKKLNPTTHPLVCPECGKDLQFYQERTCTVDAARGHLSNINIYRNVACPSCEWTADEDSPCEDIIDINLQLGILS